jgi:DNA (cytosine-5)-methyltransferase 1
MAATIQGFPPTWGIYGKKTSAYRQVGNAFPPPVAAAVARRIALALGKSRQVTHQQLLLLEQPTSYAVS